MLFIAILANEVGWNNKDSGRRQAARRYSRLIESVKYKQLEINSSEEKWGETR
jgi:hypothetical protein